ncbi:MAG: hypothetical protein KC455_08635 [Carnobacterium sp.]|nr:hypothetical protein [Carnobacterium sp.]
MKNKFNIYQFEFGTITQEETTIKIEIENSQFSHDTLKEITELPTKKDPLFLDVETVKEAENSIIYHYKKSNLLKNLTTIKNEAYPVKLSIAQEILKQDILQQYIKEDIYISLNPATIYYHPMQTVLYTYSANRFMPRDSHTTIERYKALIVSILSSIAYEKCLNSPQDVSKEGNDLVKEIYRQKTILDLLLLIQESNDYTTYNYIESRKKTENKIKKRYFYLLTGVVALSLASLSLLGVKVAGQAEELSMNYEKQLTEKDHLLNANDNFYRGNYDEAIALYEKTDYDKEKLSVDLIEKGEYQKALDIDPTSLEKIIQKAYENGQPEVVLELDDKELSEEEQAKLVDEKGIINGDTTSMLNTLNFLKDEQTATRLTTKFLEIGDMNNAKKIEEKYPENTEIKTILENAEMSHAELEKERLDIQKQMEDKQKKLDESKDDKEKETLKKEISELQEKVN